MTQVRAALVWDDATAEGGRAALLSTLRAERESSDRPDHLTLEGIGRGASAALAMVAHQRRLGVGLGRVILRDLDPAALDPISEAPMPAPPTLVLPTRIEVHAPMGGAVDEFLAAWRDRGWSVTLIAPRRERRDLCPGVFRPWAAEDGAIVRLRTPGGRISTADLVTLVHIAQSHGDGSVLVTSRANVQIRGIVAPDGMVPPDLVASLRTTALLPSDTHELSRNVVMSPLTGRVGGRADLRPVAEELDRRLCADPALADLGGRFLFVLDDGRGDVLNRTLDLGLVAVDADRGQIRVGTTGWADLIDLSAAASRLIDLARRFARIRGHDPHALWHVDELPRLGAELCGHVPRDARTRTAAAPPSVGGHRQQDGRRCEVVNLPDGFITQSVLDRLVASGAAEVVVTPWRTVVVPDLELS